MAVLATMQHDNVCWRDSAGSNHPSPRTVQMSTTDIRSLNLAAMYLSLMSRVTNEGRIVSDDGQVNVVLPELIPLFTGWGYTEPSSAGSFSDYLPQGIGSKPTVMVYKSQSLGGGGAQNSQLKPEMRLAYPSPTILNTHVMLGLNDNGAAVTRLLAEDPELRKLAAKHSY